MRNKNILWKLCKICGKTFNNLRKGGNMLSYNQFLQYKFCSKACRKENNNKKTNDFLSDSNGIYFVITKKGKHFKVYFDESDKSTISKYKWYLGSHGYPVAYNRTGDTKYPNKILLHRLLLGMSGNLVVDHINRNKLDNRRFNLRFVTYSNNCFNKGVTQNSKTGCNGVSLKKNGKYTVNIGYLKKNIHLGYFNCLEDAVKCRLAVEKVLGLNKIIFK